MFLWEAILLGSQIRPQAFGGLFRQFKGRVYGSCAWGAAGEAAGLVSKISDDVEDYPFPEEWKRFVKMKATCPCCNRIDYVNSIISTHLNDTHKWTRERIALEFVKPIEESLKVEVALPAVGVEA